MGYQYAGTQYSTKWEAQKAVITDFLTGCGKVDIGDVDLSERSVDGLADEIMDNWSLSKFFCGSNEVSKERVVELLHRYFGESSVNSELGKEPRRYSVPPRSPFIRRIVTCFRVRKRDENGKYVDLVTVLVESRGFGGGHLMKRWVAKRVPWPVDAATEDIRWLWSFPGRLDEVPITNERYTLRMG